MKISHFLAKIYHFGDHFEFFNFSGMKRHRKSNILTDSCSTPNLAMETTCFIPDLKKKIRYAQPYYKMLVLMKTFQSYNYTSRQIPEGTVNMFISCWPRAFTTQCRCSRGLS